MTTNVLACGSASAAAQTSTGPVICACFGVGLHTLHHAIVNREITTVAEIGAALRAGTNCGSCIPELRAMLERSETSLAPT
jgi:assimilatory nitrate reductase catalytic subunit